MRIALSVLAVLVLAGCAAAPTNAPSTPTAEPTPTPTVMTTVEAADAYMRSVCPSNIAIDANNAAWDAQDLTQIVTTAAAAREATRTSAETLDGYAGTWPAEVADDIDSVFDALLADVSYFDAVASAATIEQAYAVPPAATEDPEAPQRVRLRLELPSDTAKGCLAYVQ